MKHITGHIMKVRNIQLKSIEARRYIKPSERPKQIRIDHNSSVNQIDVVKNNIAEFSFQYTASFGPVGMVKLEGILIFESDDVKKIAGQWSEKRKMPDQIASNIHTAIMHACVPEAVGISKSLGLPPPIPLPQVKMGGKKSSTANFGPEVA